MDAGLEAVNDWITSLETISHIRAVSSSVALSDLVSAFFAALDREDCHSQSLNHENT